MFLMPMEKIEMLLQVDWEEYYSHYLVDLLGLDQVREEIGLKRSKLSYAEAKQCNDTFKGTIYSIWGKINNNNKICRSK